MKKLSLLLLLVVGALLPMSAAEILVNGIYYNVGMTTAEVLPPKEGSGVTYSGDIEIPTEVMAFPVSGIAAGAFRNCTELESIKLPSTFWYIDEQAFYGCSGLTSFEIPEGVSFIEKSTFSGCSSLESVIIPKSVMRIEEDAFFQCLDLSSVTIPDEVTYIGCNAFGMCDNLSEATLGSSVEVIEERAFSNCENLRSINLPNSVKTIGQSAFSCCESLSSITIPGSVIKILPGTFLSCKGLTNVVIGSGVTIIETSAFANCIGLKEIRCENPNPPTIETSNVFKGVDLANCKVVVPEGSLAKYRAADGWKEFKLIDDGSVVTGINDVANDIEPISIIGNSLQANTDCVITIYTIDGRLTLKRQFAANESAVLPQGVYLIYAHGNAYKVQMR